MPTFAEIMAAKKAAAAAKTASPVPISPEAPASLVPIEEKGEEIKEEQTKKPVEVVQLSEEKPAPIPVSGDSIVPQSQVQESQNPPDSPKPEVNPEAQQAYADIKEKLKILSFADGDDLSTAMKDLKRSLMQNPSAVLLMEDIDIGQMVIALRKLTGEAITEAAKEKAKGRPKKDKGIDLSDPVAVQAAFDEL